MPLRTLLGDGNPQIIENCFSKINASKVVLVGTRDLDSPEEKYINEYNITTVSTDNINKGTILNSTVFCEA